MKIVCIPVYNEEKSISDVVKRSQNFVNKIIVCDLITHSTVVVSSFLELIAINYPLRIFRIKIKYDNYIKIN